MKGTAPAGIATEREAARWVRAMFGRIAPRYDLANHVLSLNLDRHWRARTAKRLEPVLRRPDSRSLDLCCGTGDLLLALQAKSAGAVIGSDFCHPMLTAARQKIARRRFRCPLFEADALSLPLEDDSLDLITVAFGFRNLADYQAGLAEMYRVLKPSGVAAILEFSQPGNTAFGRLYNIYSRKLLPVFGGVLSGSRDAYAYLPESIGKFPSAEQLAAHMRAARFRAVEFTRMTGGTVALHLGTK
ncbi:MAG TPA: bifunctional demethylmenaquinone methyltransferase/2-methoxy-6-polyprenyl-1,4-benzoquinol methylase UbiE [Bryobacteraceae bacterium]|nr:bifunctional demethylmenaquinone methyltransferase/2-methoxy-6-polyprenyl-1,4-benzoquinol methylase UbiE [Bryobacteraceae bacterium]